MKKMIVTMAAAAAMFAGTAQAAPASAMMCAGCHGAEGIATNPTYPNLAGQHAVYLETALKAYRSGERMDPVMSNFAKNLTDEQIAELAEYYESLY